MTHQQSIVAKQIDNKYGERNQQVKSSIEP